MLLLRRGRLRLRTTFLVLLVFSFAFPLLSDDTPTAKPEDVLSFLNQSIVWYHQLAAQEQLVIEPSDAVFLDESRQTAEQIIRLSFDFARSQAQILASQGKTAGAANPQEQTNPTQYQNLTNVAEKSAQEIKRVQQEIDSLKQQVATAAGKQRALLQSQLAETEGELDLLQARRDAIQNLLDFAGGMSSATSGVGGFRAQIEDLARTVPIVNVQNIKSATAPASPGTPVSVATASDRASQSGGIFGLFSDVLGLRRKRILLDDALRLTDSLRNSANTLRSPLAAPLREAARRADEFANQPAAQDQATLTQQRAELAAMTTGFKQLSSAVVPLSKQGMLLDLYKKNLTNWREVVQGQYSARLKNLVFRLAILGLVIFVVLGVADIWRRVTFRYITDVRRRHQFLILRRIVVWPVLIGIIIVAFANGLGSVTTFLGLLTAGMAVALQNLILSVVGYFFLIGKYGVRVGDRIQVSGVTGDVVDIGLVRMYLMELGAGIGPRPTGRLVAFSNAVVFQPDAGIFKQIPGANFVWHEVSLTLSPESDYRQAEEKMLQAVNGIFEGYREKIESQRRDMERAINVVSINSLQPESRLNLTSAGLQVTIRYPVEIEHASQIDDRVTREILAATGREPKVTVSEPPSPSDGNMGEATG